MGKRKCSKEELREAIENSASIAEALRKVGLVPSGGNYATAKSAVKEFKIDTSHMTGQGWNKGDKMGLREMNTISMERILVRDSTYVCTNSLRKRLINAGLKRLICERCKRGSWNGKQIPLELNHVNGDRFDNRIENLQLPCPNCHAQTHCYRGKNIGKIKN